MAKITTQGKCLLCGGTFSKAAMSRHLAKCLQPKEGGKATRFFHLQIQGLYQPQYWLHLGAPLTAKLYDLDAFLRHIWLECCDHLSGFTIAGTTYAVQPMESFWGSRRQEDMHAALGRVLRPDLKFIHEYDYGSTTRLALKVIAEREGEIKGPVQLLARNEPPPIPCGVCGEPATLVTSEHGWSEDSWLC